MSTASMAVLVFEIGVWVLLAAIAMDHFASARSQGEASGAWRNAKRLAAVVVLAAAVLVVKTFESGDANPLMFEYAMLLGIGALVTHDARARGEWAWGGRIHGCFAVLAVICGLSGRYSEVTPLGFSDGSGAWMWVTAGAALIFGLAPLVAYGIARGPRLDGAMPTVTFVKGVMGASSVGAVMALPRVIIAVIILAGILINAGNVVGRYVYLAPIIWAEEIMIYGMVWTVFVGAVLVTWDSRHLRMDLVSTMLPSPWKEILNGVGVAAFLAVGIFVIPQNWTVFSMMYRFDQRSVVAEVPMLVPHFALLLGFSLMFLVMLWILFGLILNVLTRSMRTRGLDPKFLAGLLRFHRRITGDTERSEIEDLVAGEGEGSSGPAAGG